MQKKTFHLEPIPTEWGEVTIAVRLATAKDHGTGINWEITYPEGVPKDAKHDLDVMIETLIKHQYTDLVRLFS